MRTKFWIVWIEGNRLPSKLHLLYSEARAEAERLASKEQKPAYIFETVGGFEPVSPPVREFNMDEASESFSAVDEL